MKKFILFVICMVFAGCAASPALKGPKLDLPTGYTALSMPGKTAASSVQGGAAQSFAFGAKIPEAWWKLFKCEDLDRVIKMAIEDSPNLAAAKAALRQAQEVLAEVSTESADIGVVLFSALSRQGLGDVAGTLHGWIHAAGR